MTDQTPDANLCSANTEVTDRRPLFSLMTEVVRVAFGQIMHRLTAHLLLDDVVLELDACGFGALPKARLSLDNSSTQIVPLRRDPFRSGVTSGADWQSDIRE